MCRMGEKQKRISGEKRGWRYGDGQGGQGARGQLRLTWTGGIPRDPRNVFSITKGAQTRGYRPQGQA